MSSCTAAVAHDPFVPAQPFSDAMHQQDSVMTPVDFGDDKTPVGDDLRPRK